MSPSLQPSIGELEKIGRKREICLFSPLVSTSGTALLEAIPSRRRDGFDIGKMGSLRVADQDLLAGEALLDLGNRNHVRHRRSFPKGPWDVCFGRMFANADRRQVAVNSRAR
jgi:hypothetical protein